MTGISDEQLAEALDLRADRSVKMRLWQYFTILFSIVAGAITLGILYGTMCAAQNEQAAAMKNMQEKFERTLEKLDDLDKRVLAVEIQMKLRVAIRTYGSPVSE